MSFRNANLMLFFLILIFKSNLSQPGGQDWTSQHGGQNWTSQPGGQNWTSEWGDQDGSGQYQALTRELDGLISNVSVIQAQLNRILGNKFCSAQQCGQLQSSLSALSNQLQNISLQIDANSQQIQDNENRIQVLETDKENEAATEALENNCELTFPFGGDLERYRSLVYTWIISGANTALTSAAASIETPTFPVPDQGFNAQTRIQRNNNSQYIMSTQFIGIGTPTEVPAVHYVQVDQSGQCLSAIYTDMFLFGGYLTGYNYYRPLTKVLSAPYLSSADTLAFNVHVESQHSMQNIFSYSGVLIDQMEDYKWQKGRIEKGYAMFYYGPYFYTSAQGYKVNVRVIPGGAQKVTFLVCFVLGKFDAKLTADFLHTSTVTIFNPKIPSLFLNGSLQWNLKDRNYYNVDVNIPSNFQQDYLLDDTLYYKVVITS